MSTTETNPQAGSGQSLPKKEADLFRSVVKHYEMKQYKKAIKQADAILKRFPNHGETLAMKGLTLNYMSKKEEAHDLAKRGLMHDMRSHICWHVYGLLYRSDRNYNEAIKAYKQALRIDPENLQILRDLSMLQIQMRDLNGFAVTRNTLLTLKSNAKINWIAFALAKHIAKDLREAVKVIDIYLGTLGEESEELGRCFESGELALYKNSIIAEIQDNYQEALDHLKVCEGIVVDRGAWLLMKAEYQLKLHYYVEAQQTVMALFERGMTENYRVHSIFMCALLRLDDPLCEEALRLKGTRTAASCFPLSPQQKQMVLDAYQNKLMPRFSSSTAVQRIPMQLLDGNDLMKALESRCRRDLSNGVPSLCSELRSHLWVEEGGRFVRPDDPVDVKVHPLFVSIVAMVDSLVESLQACSKFSPADEQEEPPSTIMWAWYLRAGLHELCGEYLEGIALLEKCLEHTPTAVDVYEMKARLLRQAGDIMGAVDCIDKGRDLDRQDRYINNQTTRYMLEAGMDEQALKTISMFAKHEGNPEQNLFDMQCSWFELEVAACYARKQDWGRSLKKYAAVAKHFDDINEDQFDFHHYCIRKATLRSYVDVLRFEDEAYGADYFREAAAGLIRIYLHLFDNPAYDDDEDPDYSKMSAAERKKAKAIARKKRKAAEKKLEVESSKVEPDNQNGNKPHKTGKQQTADPDPLGKEYLKKDPLDEAAKFSAMLTRYAPKSLESWLLGYDVAVRRKKPLMALQALHKGRAIDSRSGELFVRTVDFADKVESFSDLSDPARLVLTEMTPPLLEHKSVTDFVKDTAATVDSSSSLPYRMSIAKALVASQSGTVAEACAVITKYGTWTRGASVQTCRDALSLLQSFGADAVKSCAEWKAAVKAQFPLLADL